MKFVPIDLKTWPRSQMFAYFAKMAPTGYSLTVNVDVTLLRNICRKADIGFFPAYIWLVTKNLNRQIEFKTAVKDGVLGYYDTLTPLYASFHEDDHSFSLMWTEYTDSFPAFYQAYRENRERYGENHGVLSNPLVLPPENAYTVSCVPWISFTHFAVHSYENKAYYFPSVEAGRFFEIDGKFMMPLSLSCHHAATDGWHIRNFLDALQEDMDHFSRYIE